jgi:hypothetical protein
MENKTLEEQVQERRREGAEVVRTMDGILGLFGKRGERKELRFYHPNINVKHGGQIYEQEITLESQGLELVKKLKETTIYQERGPSDYRTDAWFTARYNKKVVLRTEEISGADYLLNPNSEYYEENTGEIGEHIEVYKPSQNWLDIFNPLAKKAQRKGEEIEKNRQKEIKACKESDEARKNREREQKEKQLKENFGL